ncbi:AbfB domain-containing protein [Actinoplanes sp. NPDC049668]|uniref:AbfB domain-containing protein n=1 Tax=unclassified Actinoplanes TaxID=2626549 RepID=UPI0033A22EAF
MSPEDGNRPDLRVGGWIPPIQYFAPTEPRRSSAVAEIPAALVAAPPGRRRRLPPQARARTVLAGAAVLSALAAAGLALTQGEPESRGAPSFILPAGPVVPALPLPSTSGPAPSASRAAGIATSDLSRPVVPPGGPATEPARHRPSASPSRAALPVAGAEIGLQPAGESGRRVRHRDFRARIDAIGPNSSALDRADSRFTVRAGRANGSCVSFESANYPGYFLRHRNYALRLDRVDGSALFNADSTFCAVPVAGGFVLRSHNYPDRFLTESDSVLLLTRTSAAAAKAFVTRSPLGGLS